MNKIYSAFGYIWKTKYLLLFLLIVVNFMVHWRILAPRVISYGDFDYFYVENLDDRASGSIWNDSHNYGGQEFAPFREPLNQAYGLASSDKHVSEKFLVVYPALAIAAMAPYLIAFELTRRKEAGLVAFVVFNFNSYFMVSSEHFLLYAAAAFATLGIYMQIAGMRVRRVRNNDEHVRVRSRVLMLGSFIPFFISTAYDFRMTYIAYFILACLLFLLLTNKKYYRRELSRGYILKTEAIFLTTTLVSNLYWLKAVLAGGASSISSTGRSLFGDQFWGLDHAIALHHPFWKFGEVTWFQAGPVPLLFWIIPIAALAGVVAFRSRLPYVLLFIAVIGIFLVKQSDAPFGQIYGLLYDRVPGFNAFREATKFYYLIVFAYSLLIGMCVLGILNAKRFFRRTSYKAVLIAIVLLPFLLSTIPIITGSHGSIYSRRSINTEYRILKDIVRSQSDSFRVLWTPQQSIWAYSDSTHPLLNLSTAIENEFKGLLPGKNENLSAFTFFEQDYANYVLDYSSVKYIVVPLDDPENSDTLFTYYPNSRQEYIDTLASLKYLKRLDIPGVNELAIFENDNYQPRLTAAYNIASLDSGIEPNPAISEHEAILEQTDVDYIELFGSKPLSPLIMTPFSTLQPAQQISEGNYELMRVQSAEIWYSLKDNIFQLEARLPGLSSSLAGVYEEYVSDKVIKIAEYETIPDQVYAVLVNDATITMLDQNKAGRLGLADSIDKIKLVRMSNNKLPNGSFEAGLWNTEIQDCDNYDSEPNISGGLLSDTDGAPFVRLKAVRHSACIFKGAEGTSSGVAHLSFEARANQDTQAKVAVVVDGSILYTLPIDNLSGEWSSYVEDIKLPDESQNVSVYLYSDENLDRLTESSVDYRDIALQLPIITTDYTDAKERVPTVYSDEFVVSDDLLVEANAIEEGQNLIGNGDFSEGLWHEEVGDCFNYDNNPQISMELVGGAVSLVSDRHNACTDQELTFKREGFYELSLDYRVTEGDNASIAMVFDGDHAEVTRFDLPVDDNPQTFRKLISVPLGTESSKIYLYSNESENGKTNQVIYDNVSLVFRGRGDSAWFYHPSLVKTSPPAVNFESVSAYEKKVYLDGTLTQDSNLYLAFNDIYDSGWQLFANLEGKEVAIGTHTSINGIFNLWRINRLQASELASQGTDKIALTLRYSPQSSYHVLYNLNYLLFGGLATYVVVADLRYSDKLRKLWRKQANE